MKGQDKRNDLFIEEPEILIFRLLQRRTVARLCNKIII
jgi:hypothetical protein